MQIRAIWTSGSSTLAALDMRVEVAGSGTEALNKIRVAKGGYDVVILDDELPDHPGIALASELRALNLRLPLVITSRNSASLLRAEFSNDRCARVLDRPYSPAEFEHMLRGPRRKLRRRRALVASYSTAPSACFDPEPSTGAMSGHPSRRKVLVQRIRDWRRHEFGADFRTWHDLGRQAAVHAVDV